MLQLALSFLVAASTTSALSTSYWITQQIEKIDQSPLLESAASFAPPALYPQEQPPVPAQQSAVSLVYQFKIKLR